MLTDTERTVKEHIEEQLISRGLNPSWQIQDICVKIEEYLTLNGMKRFEEYGTNDDISNTQIRNKQKIKNKKRK